MKIKNLFMSVLLVIAVSILTGITCYAQSSSNDNEKILWASDYAEMIQSGDMLSQHFAVGETPGVSGNTGLRKNSSYTRAQALDALRSLFRKAFAECKSVVDISEYQIDYSDPGRDLVTEAYQSAVTGENFYITGDMELGYGQKTRIIKLVNIGYGEKFQKSGKSEGSLPAPDKEAIKKARARFETAVSKALSVVRRGSNDLEKVLLLHDYLVTECSYDYENLRSNGFYPDIDYTAYGVLVERRAVCNGYAFAFSWLAQKLGIESYIMASETMNHAWNLVKVGGKWYHLDASRDDEVFARGVTYFKYGNSDSADEGFVSHKYFLKSDGEMKAYNYYNWSIQASSAAVPSANTSGSYASCLFRRYPLGCFAKISGKWYLGSLKARKIYRSDSLSGNPKAVCSFDDFLYAVPYGNMIYFSREGGVYRYEPAKNEIRAIYQTDGTGTVVSEMGVKGEKLVYVTLARSGKSSRVEKAIGEVKTYAIPSAPTIKKTKVNADGLKISWSKVSSADGYVLYYSESKSGKLSVLATLQGAGKTSYKYQPGDLKTRYYKVRAFKKNSGMTVYSDFSSQISLKMKNGWMNFPDGSRKYYKKGKVLKGWKKIGKKKYYFNKKTGKQMTGLTKIGKNTYYLYKKGGFATGKKKIKGKKYYFRKNGKLYKIV